MLGAVLVDNQAFNSAAEMLTREDFYRDSHRRIFDAMAALAERSQPIDLVTLKDELQRESALEAVGGAAYLGGLLDGVPRITSVEHWSRIIKEKAVLRKLIHAGNRIVQSCLRGRGRAGGAPRPGRAVDLRDRREADPRRLRVHARDRQGELPHHRPALAVEGRGERARHGLRGHRRDDERAAEGRARDRGRAAGDGQDLLLPQHRAARRACAWGRRSASSRSRCRRSSSRCACCAPTPASTRIGCAPASSTRRTGRGSPRPTATSPSRASSSTTRPRSRRSRCAPSAGA